jgi:hypothetical protein
LKRALALLALGIVSSSCAHAPAGGKGQVLALDRGQVGRLDGGGRLIFANVVNDSRCPKGAQCVWAGTATVHLQLVPDPAVADTVNLLAVLDGGEPRAEAAAQLPVDTLGVSITLLDLAPYPVVGRGTAGVRPRATIRVAPTGR